MIGQPIVIHALRRSGSTIFWESLRTDPSITCFDEPFHPRFAEGARQNHKGTWTEMAASLHPDAPSPVGIAPLEELRAETSSAEHAWLGHLLASGERVAIDIVRCWNRLPDLYPQGTNCLTIHLIRDPVGWAEAHLLPQGKGTWRKPIGDAWRRLSRYRRRGFYDNYQYQTIIEAALSQRHPVMCQTALSPEALLRAPAYVRLLAFWWGANCILWRAATAAGLPRHAITHDEFTHDPQGSLERITAKAGWQGTRFDSRAVTPSGRPTCAADPRWSEAMWRLGLPEELLTARPLRGADMARLFEAHETGSRVTP